MVRYSSLILNSRMTSGPIFSSGYQVFSWGYPFHLIRQNVFPSIIFVPNTFQTKQTLLISSGSNIQIMMEREEEVFDDCFCITMPEGKIRQVEFMSSSQLLVILLPHRYCLVNIVSRTQTIIVKSGIIPARSKDIKKFDSQNIVFINKNELIIFDVTLQTIRWSYAIAPSDIYTEQFLYELGGAAGPSMILFYKISMLKTTPATVYNDLHLLAVRNQLQKAKRFKVQYEDVRRFGYACGQIYSLQSRGYTIEINFLDSCVIHKIQCIFSLFLLEVRPFPHQIELDFTHEEVENQFLSYSVSKNKIKKLDRRPRDLGAHIVKDDSGLRSVSVKNCFQSQLMDYRSNYRKKCGFETAVAVFRVEISKRSKFAMLIEEVVPHNIPQNFKQMILNLLV